MRRERIEEIRQKGDYNYDEFDRICRLALRTADPGMVMVPRERLETWKSQSGMVGRHIHGFLTAHDEAQEDQQ